MGYSGLIYAAIVAGWAAVLVPRWVRRNEEVERAREVDEARGVRILDRRTTPIHAAHAPAVIPPERTVLHGGARGLSVGAAARAPRVRTPEPRVARRPGPDERPSGARRRRRVLVVLLLALVGSVAGASAGLVPGLAPWIAGGLLVVFFGLARRAAVVEARRPRVVVPRILRDDESAAASDDEPADDVRVAVLDEADLVAEPVDPDAWEPVAVPRPTYLSKPMAPRVARTIDLSQAGSWTSGRLDPAAAITLPPVRRPVAVEGALGESGTDVESDDDGYGERRAVGD